MDCPRCGISMLRQHQEWWCIVHGTYDPPAPSADLHPAPAKTRRAWAPWTEEEHHYVNEHYGAMTVREIAEALGKTPKSVECYARRAGLRRGALIRRLLATEVELARLRAVLCESCRRLV